MARARPHALESRRRGGNPRDEGRRTPGGPANFARCIGRAGRVPGRAARFAGGARTASRRADRTSGPARRIRSRGRAPGPPSRAKASGNDPDRRSDPRRPRRRSRRGVRWPTVAPQQRTRARGRRRRTAAPNPREPPAHTAPWPTDAARGHGAVWQSSAGSSTKDAAIPRWTQDPSSPNGAPAAAAWTRFCEAMRLGLAFAPESVAAAGWYVRHVNRACLQPSNRVAIGCSGD
jgi:hypothetical protein